MSKKVHLICNAHLDPIWQWDWQEGASAAISTFQSAVNLAEDFDYIFCHNEVTLYKYIEEYAPALFEKIRALVKAGKWHIMGGWYLQPDCTMPSGESFVRQIKVGHNYFKEKFGVTPKTATNFDPFGHTRGLVQILTKCGQDSYMAMRPYRTQTTLPDEQFWWVGFDGSKIKYNRTTAYNSPLGNSVGKIKGDIGCLPQPTIASLWGVGNHGGGPSRKDLEEIKEFIKEAKNEDVEVIHSTPEQFFSEIDPNCEFDKSIYLCMPGCYVTMSRLKRLHIELENELYYTEKICSAAALKGLIEYPAEKLQSITEDLLNSEFHDVLPGTSIKSGEENGIKLLNHGLLEAERLKTKAFFALTSLEEPAKEGDYPVLVFNPHPYEFDTDVECEFTLADQNWDDKIVSKISIYDDEDNLLTCQVIKEESNLTLDWRKRIIFSAKLKPFSLNRFTIKCEFLPESNEMKEEYIYKDEQKYVEIDKNTGLLKSFKLNGKEYINNAFLPVSFDDNEDPWAMNDSQLKNLGTNPQSFELCKKPSGVFGGLKSVEVVENGKVYLGIEALFEKDNSKVLVRYKIYKNRPYIDVEVRVFWQDINKLLRVAIPVNFSGKLIGQTAFGTDELFEDGRENVSHRFIALKGENECLAVFNKSTYGSCFKDNTLYISLVRGTAYCAHPIADRPLVKENHFVNRVDQCEHFYSFRIAVAQVEELERLALEFNQIPFVQNVFPVVSDIQNNAEEQKLLLDNKNIALVTVKKSDELEGYVIRLMNNSENSSTATLSLGEKSISLTFGKYEVKTVIFNGSFEELDHLVI